MSDALEFTGTIVNPEWMPTWSVIEVPGSKEFFGQGKSVKANVTVDGVAEKGFVLPARQR